MEGNGERRKGKRKGKEGGKDTRAANWWKIKRVFSSRVKLQSSSETSGQYC